MKTALLSMDVEDWYHLEYFQHGARAGRSMLDGVSRFSDVLQSEGVRATFFTLGDLAESEPGLVRSLHAAGHEIASHGPDHALPSRLSTAEFVRQLENHKDALEQVVGAPVEGYRAPCFAVNREKVEHLPSLGFRYDSSWIRFAEHPLYGAMDLEDWDEVVPGVWQAPDADFLEFEVPTASVLGRRVPIAGGAYFRIFPWTLTRALLRRHLGQGGTYVFYIHPFECSAVPRLDGVAMSAGTRLRFELGRGRTLTRLRRLIKLLRSEGFTFRTFADAARVIAT